MSTTIKPNRAEAFAMAGMVDPGAFDDPLEDSALLKPEQLFSRSLAFDRCSLL